MIKILSTGNEEVDILLGGGIPFPSLILIEGEHGTGKSAVSAQFMKGMLDAELKVLCITESTVKDYIERMKSITYDFSKPFLTNQMTIVPLYVYGTKWSEKESSCLLPFISGYINNQAKKNNCIVIDSLSFFTMHTDNENILDFVKKCKHIVASGISIILTIHPNSLSKDIEMQIKSACDAYFLLDSKFIGNTPVKIMKVIKLIGSISKIESTFAFDVDTAFGIKIVPISMAST